MEIGIVGLGKMGLGISKRLIKNGHSVFGYDSQWKNVDYNSTGISGSNSIPDLVDQLTSEPQKVIWVMVPSGSATESSRSRIMASGLCIPAFSISFGWLPGR